MCNCIDEINQKLKDGDYKTEIETTLIDPTGKAIWRPRVVTKGTAGNKKPVPVFASCCPFCGKPYKEQEQSMKCPNCGGTEFKKPRSLWDRLQRRQEGKTVLVEVCKHCGWAHTEPQIADVYIVERPLRESEKK
jgi:hypothetical protein